MSENDNFREKVETEEDYIHSKKYNYSYNAFLNRNRGTKNSDKLICTLLLLEPDELDSIWNKILEKGRQYFKIDVE